ncbi:MAG: excinuclease ABC subunit UvrC [Oscillospiraceae bacterium]|nr:excinuclease ABC subunit UvrC [Oscillospiraceae bacterium]
MTNLRAKALALPMLPGVYLMKDAKGGVLYVGKAKNLRARLCQYFTAQGLQGHCYIGLGLQHVADFDTIITGSEYEALVLEQSLIKQHNPKYNLCLKDDKGFLFLRVTREDWPRLSIAQRQADDGAAYYGPYTDRGAFRLAVDEAQQIYQLPTCSKTFPRDIGKGRPCLQHYIKRCAAPCARKLKHAEFVQSVRDAEKYLSQGSAQAERELRRAMELAAEELQFERAAQLRDKLHALEKLKEKQHVVSVNVEDQDVFALAADAKQACLTVLRFCEGKLCDSENFFLARIEPLEEFRQVLLERFYSSRDVGRLRRVVLDGPTQSPELLAQWLTDIAGHKVEILVAQKSEPARLVDLARQNAVEQLANKTGRQGGKQFAALEELARMLGLPAPPETIEAYDISHTGGADTVAAMVVFKHGQPFKAGYRRYAIQGQGNDDYAAMAEVLERRLSRLEEMPAPELILLDGGIGQVHAVQPVLARHGVVIPVFGMVKDSKHKTRAIAAGGGGEISFNATKQAFALVTKIQDEVHRFAVAYHHTKHKKTTLDSELMGIPGIGPARVKALLTHFKTLKAIKAATQEELAATPGMTKPTARWVWEHFQAGE